MTCTASPTDPDGGDARAVVHRPRPKLARPAHLHPLLQPPSVGTVVEPFGGMDLRGQRGRRQASRRIFGNAVARREEPDPKTLAVARVACRRRRLQPVHYAGEMRLVRLRSPQRVDRGDGDAEEAGWQPASTGARGFRIRSPAASRPIAAAASVCVTSAGSTAARRGAVNWPRATFPTRVTLTGTRPAFSSSLISVSKLDARPVLQRGEQHRAADGRMAGERQLDSSA